jgi:hypothetical protein
MRSFAKKTRCFSCNKKASTKAWGFRGEAVCFECMTTAPVPRH